VPLGGPLRVAKSWRIFTVNPRSSVRDLDMSMTNSIDVSASHRTGRSAPANAASSSAASPAVPFATDGAEIHLDGRIPPVRHGKHFVLQQFITVGAPAMSDTVQRRRPVRDGDQSLIRVRPAARGGCAGDAAG
jgi:hypothetical protein